MDESFDKKTGKNKAGRIRLLVGIPDTADISALTKSLEEVKKLSRVEMREKF
jgi:hypothetical protein